MQLNERLAAVDLGSNSYRLETGHFENGSFSRSEYLKETIRQGGGLDASGNLNHEAMQRGWDCLARFGERLAGYAPDQVSAVATQTLREANNREVFLERANALLGFPIRVISGAEEARLIYQGVAQGLPSTNERRLVIDIGGRSTELVLGNGLVPTQMASYEVGSIAWSMRYFADGTFLASSFVAAEEAAKSALHNALGLYPRDRWDVAYGSAGTVNAIEEVLAAAGWSPGSVSQEGLDWLLDQLLAVRHIKQLRLPGMKEDRKAIIGGGLALMRALFDLLGISRLEQATGGLRHGLLIDLLAHQSATIVQRIACR